MESQKPGIHEGIDLEFENHIAERTDRLIEQGWEPAKARAEAERRFGELDAHRADLLAEARIEPPRNRLRGGIEAVVQDVRYALRGIRKNPGFAATLVATLALGIGATGGVFSVVDAVLLRPLPYFEPDRLVYAQPNLADRGIVLTEFQTDQVTPWVERVEFLSQVALHNRVGVLRTDGERATEVNAMAVSHNLDELLGVDAAMGRMLAHDDESGDRRVAVLSWAYWSQQGADPDVLGSTMELDGNTWEVVGVLPRGVKFPVAGSSEMWIPRSSDGSVLGRKRSQTGVVGRIVDGVDLSVAQERTDALAAQLDESQPVDLGWSVALKPVGEWRANSDTAKGLWLVAGAVALMLVIALVNGVNLLLVHGQSRIAEIGVRKALGASGPRIVRQVLVESLLLSLAGGAAATAVAWGAVEAIRLVAPSEVTFGMVHDFGLESRALTVVFLVATVSGLLIGALPGLRLAETRVAGSGSADGRARDRGSARLRSALVVVEIAVSVVLLVGAGLFIRSFSEMSRVDVGMAVDEVAVLTVDLPSARYPDGPARAAFLDSFLNRLGSIPEVKSATVGMGAPPRGGGLTFGSAIQPEGGDVVEGENVIPFVTVGPDYFETLGSRLVLGRNLRRGDRETNGVIVDRDMATGLFGDAAPVGRRFTLDSTAEDVEWLTVVGVVEELTLGGPDDRNGSWALAYPINLDAPRSYLTFVTRTSGDPQALLPSIRSALRGEDDRLPIVSLQTGTAEMAEALSRPRFLVLLMSVLAGLALLLASIGIYGVVSFAVRQRRREMGIRLALGAPHQSLRRRIVAWGLTLGAVGTGAGVAAALLLDELARALLFEVAPGDGPTLIGVASLMVAVSVVACLVPAHRATRVDPVEVLRAE